jgi:hypothetical protein
MHFQEVYFYIRTCILFYMDSVRKCLDNGVLMYLVPFHYFVAAMPVQTILAHCISEAGNIGMKIG